MTSPGVELDGARIGYVPYDRGLRRPGDRRRFCFYAESRQLRYEIADPSNAYDIVVLSAKADITEWARYRPDQAKLVYDLIDSYLDVPRFEPRSMVRGPAKFVARETRRLALDYRGAMERMCRRADAVVCSTEEQRAPIAALCPNTHAILDFQSHLVRARKHDYAMGETLNLFWEGLPQNLTAFEELLPALHEVSGSYPLSLHLVTDLRYGRVLGRYWKTSTEKHVRHLLKRCFLYQWNESMLAPIATSCDLGIIPISRGNRLMWGKPENKLLLLWRMGLPVLVSDTPAYVRTMAACDLDMTCGSTSEWVESLSRYGGDDDARARSAQVGQTYSEREHGDEQLLQRWDAMFASIL